MFLAKNTSRKTGRTYLQIVHSYRDNQGKTKRKVIQSLGYLDELEKEYDDPIAHFTQIAKQMEAERKKGKQFTLTFDADSKIDRNSTNRKNFGHVVFSKVYHELQLDRFFNNKQRHEMKDIYRVEDVSLKRKKILVIDDISTTGTTLISIYNEIIKTCGSRNEIYFFTLGKTEHNEEFPFVIEGHENENPRDVNDRFCYYFESKLKVEQQPSVKHEKGDYDPNFESLVNALENQDRMKKHY
jgi:phosphoribosylpyrophosphate synthetase